MSGFPLALMTNDFFPKNTGYVPYSHCHNYVKQLSSAIPYSGPGQADRLRLMEKIGMKNYSKFHRNRFEWDKLKNKIPLIYLKEIGVDLKTLAYCLELDYQAYREEISKERRIFDAFGVIVGGFGSRIPVTDKEEGATEEEAIEYLHQYMKKAKFRRAVIYFPGIVYHEFLRDTGYASTDWFYPGFTIRNNLLVRNSSSEYTGIVGLDAYLRKLNPGG
ncbi:MAG: hypothetical protein ACOCYD_02640 [bacterium]